jgi:hypothetical protein
MWYNNVMRTKWTENEKQILVINYTYGDKNKLLDLLPNRSWNSIPAYTGKIRKKEVYSD